MKIGNIIGAATWPCIVVCLSIGSSCKRSTTSTSPISPPNAAAVTIAATPAHCRAADRILRLSNEAVAEFLSPAGQAQTTANLVAEADATDFARLPALRTFLDALQAVNSYVVARSEVTAASDVETANSSQTSWDAEVSYQQITPAVFRVLAGGGLTTQHDLRERQLATYEIRPRPEFRPEEFAKLLAACSSAHTTLVADLRGRGFSYELQREELCGQKWDWRWASEEPKATITFNFRLDGTFDAELHPDSSWDWPGLGLVNAGFGEWQLEDNRLTVTMTHVSLMGVRKEHRVEFLSNRTVDEFGPQEILLSGDSDRRLTASTK